MSSMSVVRLLIEADQSCETVQPFENRADSDEPIVLTFKVGCDARPWPILGSLGQSSADRIETDIPYRSDQVSLVYGYRRIAAIEKVAGPPASGVDEGGISPMAFAHGPAKRSPVGWHEDQLYMIWHQAVCPDLDPRLSGLPGEQIKIDILIAILEEYWLTPVPTRRDVVWNLRDNDASEPS